VSAHARPLVWNTYSAADMPGAGPVLRARGASRAQ
jgi:hypothetical protein